MALTTAEIKELLHKYGILEFEAFELIDSSHGDRDIRHNYIIDKKYVLRINLVKVMTENRIRELNVLIQRYNDFGLKAPYFICSTTGDYLTEQDGYYCYLSEYLDYELADNVKETCRERLIEERIRLVSSFAEKYKNVDLIDTMSMYSLFELSPYDMEIGIDEKQDNFNVLIADLQEAGENELAEELTAEYEKVRAELLQFYKTLPRCVFQGDENFSNLCVDEEKHIIGLFDFNMSGSEVIANYLANIAFQGNFYYTEEILEEHSAREVFDKVVDSYQKSTERIKDYYHFTADEWRAYKLYSKIVMISGYVNQAAFSYFLKDERYQSKATTLIRMILEFEFV